MDSKNALCAPKRSAPLTAASITIRRSVQSLQIARGRTRLMTSTKSEPAQSWRSVTSSSGVSKAPEEKRYCTDVPIAPHRMPARRTSATPVRLERSTGIKKMKSAWFSTPVSLSYQAERELATTQKRHRAPPCQRRPMSLDDAPLPCSARQNPSAGMKLALGWPHSGQVQSSGRSLKGVPGSMPNSGSPSSGS